MYKLGKTFLMVVVFLSMSQMALADDDSSCPEGMTKKSLQCTTHQVFCDNNQCCHCVTPK